MRYLKTILFLLIITSIGLAREPQNLDLPYKLFFLGDSLLYVQETTVPREAFSIEDMIHQFAWSPDRGLIFILLNSNGQTVAQIYDNNFSLVNQYILNLYGHWVNFPVTWSEDSKNIIAIQQNESGQPIISIMPINLEQDIQNIEMPLKVSSSIHQVYWSPDSSVVAYQTDDISYPSSAFTSQGQPREFRLHLFDFTSNIMTDIAETSFSGCVAWSSDSNQLAYIENRTLDEDYPFFLRSHDLVIHQFSDNVKQSIELPHEGLRAFDCPIAWSRDRKFIALSEHLADEFNESNFQSSRTGVSTIYIATKEVHNIFYTDGEPYTVFNMTWSPDDAWIAIQANYSAFSDIRLINLKQGPEYMIRLDGTPLHNPVWFENDT